MRLQNNQIALNHPELTKIKLLLNFRLYLLQRFRNISRIFSVGEKNVICVVTSYVPLRLESFESNMEFAKSRGSSVGVAMG
jgi:hypothetical protein